jgi:hypothetical protein
LVPLSMATKTISYYGHVSKCLISLNLSLIFGEGGGLPQMIKTWILIQCSFPKLVH